MHRFREHEERAVPLESKHLRWYLLELIGKDEVVLHCTAKFFRTSQSTLENKRTQVLSDLGESVPHIKAKVSITDMSPETQS